MNRMIAVFFILAGIATVAEAQNDTAVEQEKENTTTLYLKNGTEHETRFIGRTRNGNISIERLEGAGQMVFEPQGIKYIEFPLKLDWREIERLRDEGKQDEADEKLAAAIDPWLYYLDVPSNVAPWAMDLMRNLYWNGQMDAAEALAKRIEYRSPNEDMVKEAELYRTLILLDGDARKGVEKARDLGQMARGHDLASLYWYIQIKRMVLEEDWAGVKRNAAKMVACDAKNFDWLPIGLYWSMKSQLADSAPHVAETILKEMTLQFKGSRWTRMARAALEIYPEYQKARDASGNKRHGEYRGTPRRNQAGMDGRSGSTVAFDGRDDQVYLDIGKEVGTFSLSLWFVTENKNCGIMSFEDSEEGPANDIYLRHSNLRAFVDEGNQAETRGEHFADGNWHHLVYTFDGDSTEQKMYIDGEKIAGSAGTARGELQTVKSVRVGFSAMAEKSFFEGRIDDFQLYPQILGEDEVVQLFNRAKGGVALDGMLVHFKFDDAPTETILAYQPAPDEIAPLENSDITDGEVEIKEKGQTDDKEK